MLEKLKLGITSLETELGPNGTRLLPKLVLGELHSVADGHTKPMAGDNDAPPVGVEVRVEGTKRNFIIKMRSLPAQRGGAATTKANLLEYQRAPVCTSLSKF